NGRIEIRYRLADTMPSDLSVPLTGVSLELRWFAGLIGAVRDCQVQRRRFTTALNELPAELVAWPSAHQLQ
ncbi:MAG TPA: hypothetical protein VN959_06570, partial [Mycobacterium sp.]|nr:hypothetical protein [Mycobacterium sp.]